MQLRYKLDGSLLKAELILRRSQYGKRNYIILVHGRSGNRAAIGRLAAVIDYEIADCSRTERTALLLAGFYLDGAGRKQAPLGRLVQALKRPLPRSVRKKANEPMPNGQGRHSTAGTSPNQISRVSNAPRSARKHARIRLPKKQTAHAKPCAA